MNMNINIGNSINMDAFKHVSGVQNINIDVTEKPSFEEYLKNSLGEVNDLQVEAERQTTLLATGQAENVHDVTIAAAKAKISLDLTMAVRNKVVEAYKEVMRMQV